MSLYVVAHIGAVAHEIDAISAAYSALLIKDLFVFPVCSLISQCSSRGELRGDGGSFVPRCSAAS